MNNNFVYRILILTIGSIPISSFTSTNEFKSITAKRLEDNQVIQLDGILTENAWQRTTPVSEFLQQEPIEGEPASEKTEVFIVFNQDHLYIGAILYDSDSERILAYQKQRDADLSTDDRFRWILDTFRDGRTGYFFEINPAGMMGDGLLGSGIGFEPNQSWDGIWEARVARSVDGWSAEICIPFRTLNFDPANDEWGINFQRTIRRKNEETLWSGHLRNQGLYLPVHAGILKGIHDVSQGIGLEVIPYASAARKYAVDEDPQICNPADMGFDVQYSITSGLRAALTVNTDFAEVEVDERRVNLTRFPLIFPEKRDFFLEGSGVYDFSVRSGPLPFFSRRIGLTDDGAPVPIQFGLRFGGQTGKNELGFLQVRTYAVDGIPSEDFSVARVKRTIFEESSIGAIYTRRAAVGAVDSLDYPDRHTVGVDLDLKTSRFLGDKNIQFEAFAVWHTDPEKGGFGAFNDFSSRGVRFNFPNDILSIWTSYREFGGQYDPAVGFRYRTSIRRLNPGISWNPRPTTSAIIRKFEFGVNHLSIWDLYGGHVETQWTDLTPFGMHFESGDGFTSYVQSKYERLDDVFEIHNGIILPVGEYHTVNWTLHGWSASHRMVSVQGSVSLGGFWSGQQDAYSIDLSVKPWVGVLFLSQFEKNDIRLVEGHFSTHLIRFVAEWHMNPRISFVGNLQYDDVSESMGLFARLRWIIRPGSDVYFVYTHNWIEDPNGFDRFRLETYSRAATMKVNYTHRF